MKSRIESVCAGYFLLHREKKERKRERERERERERIRTRKEREREINTWGGKEIVKK